MKILKLLLLNPHYTLIFLFIGVFYIIEVIIEVLMIPFLYTLDGIEMLIKQLLKLVK